MKNLPVMLHERPTPSDGSCLFWASALALLLPELNNESSFNQVYHQLFGYPDTNGKDIHEARNNVRNVLISGDYFSDPYVEFLVTAVFRNRVVKCMDDNFNDEEKSSVGVINSGGWNGYIENMRYSTNKKTLAWGGEAELKGICLLAGINIQLLEKSQSPKNYYYPGAHKNIKLIYRDHHFTYQINDKIYCNLAIQSTSLPNGDRQDRKKYCELLIDKLYPPCPSESPNFVVRRNYLDILSESKDYDTVENLIRNLEEEKLSSSYPRSNSDQKRMTSTQESNVKPIYPTNDFSSSSSSNSSISLSRSSYTLFSSKKLNAPSSTSMGEQLSKISTLKQLQEQLDGLITQREKVLIEISDPNPIQDTDRLCLGKELQKVETEISNVKNKLEVFTDSVSYSNTANEHFDHSCIGLN